MGKWMLKKLEVVVDGSVMAAAIWFVLWLLDANITINF
jgi:hypothetical protein